MYIEEIWYIDARGTGWAVRDENDRHSTTYNLIDANSIFNFVVEHRKYQKILITAENQISVYFHHLYRSFVTTSIRSIHVGR